MHLNTLTHPRGFTLVELMIVISMIIILMGITLFPYNYYMDRSRIEKDGDLIAQEWILAHNDVKNGLLYSPDAHAHLYLTFQTGASSILLSVSTGGTSPDRPYKIIPLESKVVIQ